MPKGAKTIAASPSANSLVSASTATPVRLSLTSVTTPNVNGVDRAEKKVRKHNVFCSLKTKQSMF